MKRKQIKESDSKFIYRKKKANGEIENTALKGSINKFLSIPITNRFIKHIYEYNV